MLTRPNTSRPIHQRLYRVISNQDAKISEVLREIAEQACPIWDDLGRRAQPRVPFAKLIELTPLDHDTLQPVDDRLHVVGKQLAPAGLDFFHHEPIPYRYAIVSLEARLQRWAHLLLKITWCRFLKPGWYDGGGKFVKLVTWES